MEETLRSTVGRDADVPRRIRERDIRALNIGRSAGTAGLWSRAPDIPYPTSDIPLFRVLSHERPALCFCAQQYNSKRCLGELDGFGASIASAQGNELHVSTSFLMGGSSNGE